MKEQAFNNVTMEQLNNVSRLTTRLFPPTLVMEGEIFMAENGEGQKPTNLRPQVEQPLQGTAVSNRKIPLDQSGERLRREWYSVFTPEELKNPDSRSTIESAVALGYSPEKVTSEGPVSIESKEVITNALLTDLQRIKKAEELLQQQLSEKQQTALLKAHYEGRGEVGKGGGQAGVYNYTEAQLLRKARILKNEGGFNDEQRRMLLESGLAAQPIDILSYANPVLQGIATEMTNEVNRVGVGRPPDEAFVQRIQENARRVSDLRDANPGTPIAAEANRLLGVLSGFMAEAVEATRRERAEEMETARRYGTLYGERKLTPQQIQVIRTGRMRVKDSSTGEERDVTLEEVEDEVDRIFNRMFDRVDVSPKVQFGTAFGTAGQIEFEEFRRTLNEAAADEERTLTQDQRDRAERLVRRYAEEFELREIAHNANYAVVVNVSVEDLAKFVQRFSDSMGDLAFRKDGVVEAFHFHEQALLKIREENGGYLPPYEATGEHGRELKGRLEDLMKKYMDTRFPNMPKWKKDRAISLARGMGVISGRTIEIAASSRLPEERGQSVGPRFASMYAQKIIEGIAPFRHLFYKYDIRDFRDRVFAYLLDRDESKPWSKEELADFDTAQRVDIVNGLVEDKEERFLSVLNPWKIGGVLSRTTWRIGRDPSVGALGDFAPAGSEHENWVGTGVQIELLRGGLLSPERRRQLEEKVRNTKGLMHERAVKDLNDAISGDPQAEQDIREVLQKIARIQPLKLFFNLKGSAEKPGLQERVLANLGKTEIDQELQDDLDVLVVLQERAVHDAMYDPENTLRENIQEVALSFDDATIVGDPARTARLRRFVEAVQFEFTQPQVSLYGRSRLDRFVDDLRNKEWRHPFNFGTEDAPLREYRFSKAGGNAFARRWNDMVEASKATAAAIGLMDGLNSFKTQEPVVAAIKQIYNPLANIDESLAKDRSMAIAEGVMKFYKKDWYARLPFGVGTLFNVTGSHSFAELAYGKGQMSWDEVDLNGFTRLLRDQVPITLEQQHDLQGKAGGTRIQTGEAYARLIIPIIVLALTYYVLKQASEAVTERK